MKVYYYVDKNRTRQGPILVNDLVMFDVGPKTLVWCKGMDKWKHAEEVEELAFLFVTDESMKESIMDDDIGTSQEDMAPCDEGTQTPEEYGFNMPLIQCPECGNMISDKAVKCPKCGYPVGQTLVSSPTRSFNDGGEDYYAEKPSSRKWIYAIIGILVVALVTVIILLLRNSASQETTAGDSSSEMTSEQVEEKEKTYALSTTEGGFLNIRETPSVSAAVIGKLMTGGDAAEVLGKEGDWYKIRQGNIEGYVKGTYVFVGNENEIEEYKNTVNKRANMVKNYNVIEETDYDEYPVYLGVMLNGKRVKTGIGSYQLMIIDEHDYDGNGINDCLLQYDELGGAHTPSYFCVVYYDEGSRKFKMTDPIDLGDDEGWWYLGKDDVKVEYKNDKWLFTFKYGIERKTYCFDGSKVVKHDSNRKKIASAKKTFTHMSVFNEESSEQDATRQIYFDINGDGEDELLVFTSNSSHAGGWGRYVFIEKIYWSDGRVTDHNIGGGYEITFLTSKTNGVYDILIDDIYLVKWNGNDYKPALLTIERIRSFFFDILSGKVKIKELEGSFSIEKFARTT